MTIHWKAVEQYFTVILFVFQFCNFGKFINFGLGTVRSERFSATQASCFGEPVQKFSSVIHCPFFDKQKGFSLKILGAASVGKQTKRRCGELSAVQWKI